MTEWILWAGTVGLDSPLPDRMAAARAAGCAHVSIGFDDVARATADGRTISEVADDMRAQGVNPRVLDGITWWLPLSRPPRPGGRRRVEPDAAMAIAEQLGVSSVNVIAIGREQWSVERIAEHFAGLCDRAAAFGAEVHVEFAPESGVPNLAAAWEMVQLADRPNGGILFDTWHFHRSESSLEDLRAIPGQRIMAVQVSDACADIVGTMWEDTLHHRRLPGDGCIDLPAIMATLDATGALELVGAEVFSDELATLPPEEAAVLATLRTRALV